MTILQKAAVRSALLIGLMQISPSSALANCACTMTTSTLPPRAEEMCWLTRGLIPEQIDEVCAVLHHD